MMAAATPIPAHILASAHCTDYRRLRDDEIETLRQEQKQFDENTKISVEELKKKKDLVDWLLKLLFKEIKLKNMTWKKPFKTGSAYEKVQAGEAHNFDVMVFLDISKGIWKVEEDSDRPGFCTIELISIRSKAKKAAGAQKASKLPNKKRKDLILQLLDKSRRLSALKVRKLFTSRIDEVLKRKSPLTYTIKSEETHDGASTSIEESMPVTVHRRQRGPATTLSIACPSLGVSAFTLDIVNCLHANQLSSKQHKQTCDFVAKPTDKQHAFKGENAHLWRMSYSRQESKKFKAIDDKNKIHRRVLRVFKILRANQSQLKHLKSYIYKNVLLFLSDMPDKSWSEDDMPSRFVDMIISLRNCLSEENLPAFFNPRINLLADYKHDQLEKVKGYLKRIANKGIDGYMMLLSLKEKEEMTKIAAAQSNRKKRRRKPTKPKTKTKVARVTYQDVFGDSKKPKEEKKTRAAAGFSSRLSDSLGLPKNEYDEDRFDPDTLENDRFDADLLEVHRFDDLLSLMEDCHDCGDNDNWDPIDSYTDYDFGDF